MVGSYGAVIQHGTQDHSSQSCNIHISRTYYNENSMTCETDTINNKTFSQRPRPIDEVVVTLMH